MSLNLGRFFNRPGMHRPVVKTQVVDKATALNVATLAAQTKAQG